MSDPWLSVVMPTYDGARFVAAALDSVVAEDDPGVEMVVVDDGSRDETRDVVRRYASRLALRTEFRDHHGNWVANTNVGIALARGRYVSLLHQDDLWLPGRCAELRARIDAAPEAAMHLQPTRFVDPHGRVVGLWRCPLPTGRALSGSRVWERLLVQNFIAVSAPCVRRDVLAAAGPLDEDLWYTADWRLWLEIARRGTVTYHHRPLSTFRLHRGAQTLTRSRDPDELREQLERVLDGALATLPEHRSGRRRLERLARFSVAVNLALAGRHHRGRPSFGPLLRQAAGLGPMGLGRYLYVSRLHERVLARLRAGLDSRTSAIEES